MEHPTAKTPTAARTLRCSTARSAGPVGRTPSPNSSSKARTRATAWVSPRPDSTSWVASSSC